MSTISVWVLSIAGIIVLSVLIDLILPNGSTANFIKNIFAYVVILVIITPIFSFFSNKEVNIESFFQDNEITLQTDFISSVNQSSLDNLAEKIEKKLESQNIFGVKIGIVGDIFEKTLTISQVSVDLTDLVIKENSSHINIKTSISETILTYLKIDKECIIFYE